MKRWGILVLLIIVIPLFLNGNRKTVLIKLYAEEWGIHIPIPKDSEELWGSEVSFNGDGEWINVFSYGTELNLINSGMKLITEESVSKVNSQIKNFIQTTILLYRDEKINKKLEQIQVKAQMGDYYFYKSKNNGNDYLIAIYINSEKKLYTFEWHQ
ncbi:hypothetical protein [Lysinibacillus telephonicus]|uniref:hypothetical protein n=1 Tax=Lysinibacillus telephonicus TaxID=1714840 RepID=UPI0037D85D08